MEIRQIEYFKALLEEGTFSAAARRCGIAQPSLSQQIKKLEDELGEALVVRSRSGVKLTEAGEIFRRKTWSILTEIEDVERIFSTRTGMGRGRISIGAIPTIAPYLLPKVLAKVRDQQADIGIDLLENKTENLLEKLLSGEIDFALCSDINAMVSGVSDQELFSEELLLAVSETSPLAKKRSITLASLKHCPLLVLQEGHCLKDDTVRQCRAHDFKPRHGLRCESLETMVGLIEADLGIAFIPKMAVDYYRHRAVKFKRLKDSKFSRSIRLVSLADKEFGETERCLVKAIMSNKA